MSRRTVLTRKRLNETRAKADIAIPGQPYRVHSYVGKPDPARITAGNMRPETVARIRTIAERHWGKVAS